MSIDEGVRPIPAAAFRRAVEQAGGYVEEGPAGDLWIGGPKEPPHGPILPFHGFVTPDQAQYAFLAVGLSMSSLEPLVTTKPT